MNEGYKMRIYPNREQRIKFAKTFGCVRFVYNRMLGEKIEYYKENKKMLSVTPAKYKNEYEWLKEIDSLASTMHSFICRQPTKISLNRRMQASRNSNQRKIHIAAILQIMSMETTK